MDPLVMLVLVGIGLYTYQASPTTGPKGASGGTAAPTETTLAPALPQDPSLLEAVDVVAAGLADPGTFFQRLLGGRETVPLPAEYLGPVTQAYLATGEGDNIVRAWATGTTGAFNAFMADLESSLTVATQALIWAGAPVQAYSAAPGAKEIVLQAMRERAGMIL